MRVVTGKHAQMNEVMSGSSYLSQNDLRLHFGLGPAKQVDLIEVRWPLGLVESFKNMGSCGATSWVDHESDEHKERDGHSGHPFFDSQLT